jgi:conflict system STAND superfamily ATPase
MESVLIDRPTPAQRNTTNPYVGPRPYSEDERNRYFGRERESRELLAQVLSERLVVFYAQSGAGKTSLINARLIPGLRAEGFDVLPVARVSGEVPEDTQPGNVFVFNLIARIVAADPEFLDGAQPTADLSRMSLARFLGADESSTPDSRAYPTAPTVLILDQFEELFTTHQDQWQARADFFVQLRSAQIAFPSLWIVLTMREDFIAQLDPFAHLVSNRLQSRFYMQRMGQAAALEAVASPANDAGWPFETRVADMLVDNLRELHEGGDVHGLERTTPRGEFVEPVQLQVVCYQLWERLRAAGHFTDAGTTIDSASLENALAGRSLADFVNQALGDYYEQALTKVLHTPDLDVTERELRDWFSNRLITPEATRGLVYQGPEATGGLPNAAVRLLADQFLIRSEERGGSAWYELVHDTFVRPILDANRAWMLAQTDPVSAAARIWRDNEQRGEYLLTGALLAEARRFAKANPRALGEDERAFLAASEEQAAAQAEADAARQRQLDMERLERAEREARSARRLRALMIGLLLLVVLMVSLGLVAFEQQAQVSALQFEARDTALQAEATAQVQAAEVRTSATAAAAAQVQAQAQEAAAVAARAQAQAQATAAVAVQAVATAQTQLVAASQQSKPVTVPIPGPRRAEFAPAEVNAALPTTALDNVIANLPAVYSALTEQQLSGRAVRVAAIAIIGVETPNFAPAEFGNGAQYEGRTDLGNTQPGDGARYRGRGYLQLTGRASYRAYGNALNVPLEDNPDLALRPDVAARVLAFFFKQRNLQSLADAGDWQGVLRAVNGSLNGLVGFKRIVVSLVTLPAVAAGDPSSLATDVHIWSDVPDVRQSHTWSGSAAALEWMLHTIGINYSEDDVVTLLGPDEISPDLGLLDASGQGIRDRLVAAGIPAHNGALTYNDALKMAGLQPMMLNIAGTYGSVGVRGRAGGTLQIANPAPGYRGLGKTLDRAQFDAVGHVYGVWIDV